MLTTLRRALSARPKQVATPAYLFVDNRFPNFTRQLEVFFDTGLLEAAHTTLVFRAYRENQKTVEAFGRRYSLPLLPFKKLRDLPAPCPGQVVLYPFNGLLNLRLLKHDVATHVFLTHGDSNKTPSIHRVIRLYDLILAPGVIGRDRYSEYDVLSPEDAARRVLMVGEAIVEPALRAATATPLSEADTLLYLPTWEGGTDAERYTSTEHPATCRYLVKLCERLKLSRISILPHPNLGARVGSCRKALEKLIMRLNESGLEATLSHDGATPGKVGFAAVDVSASETMATRSGVPSVVLMRSGTTLYAPSSYLAARRQALVMLDSPESRLASLNYAGTASAMEDFERFRSQLFETSSAWRNPELPSAPFQRLMALAALHRRDRRLNPLKV